MLSAVTRTVVLYLLIIAGIRLMGKRQIGELEPSELVLSLLIADLAAVPMQDFGIPLLMGAVPILTLLCLSTLLSVLTVKSLRLRALLCGRPSVVIRDRKLLVREIRKNRFTLDELLEELRTAGVTDLSSVKCAVLETTGRVSVLPRAGAQPATAEDLGLRPREGGLPAVVISDGRVLDRGLREKGLTRAWLDGELKARGIPHPRAVFLMTVDEGGRVYLAPQEEARP